MGSDSIYAEIRDMADGFEFLVKGPGTAQASYTFPDAAALDEFRAQHEQDLFARGFRLQAVTERRSGRERRQDSRPGTSDRRRR